MNLVEFQKINAERGKRWHQGDLHQWSLLEWAGAMCGEAGEAANVAKKIRRIMLFLPNREAGLTAENVEALRTQAAKEVADTIIYGLLMLSALDVDASTVIADVFNQKSEEYGFPERAPVIPPQGATVLKMVESFVTDPNFRVVVQCPLVRTTQSLDRYESYEASKTRYMIIARGPFLPDEKRVQEILQGAAMDPATGFPARKR